MRKSKLGIVSLIMSLVMCVSAFSGCGLIKVDNEKNLEQVIATVRITEQVPKADEILKKDIVMAYMNYGFQYEYSYGYTREQVMNLIVRTLVEGRVLVQKAILDFESEVAPFDGVLQEDKTTAWDLDRYLDKDERIDAEYSAIYDLNELIHSYMKNHDHEKVQDSMIDTVRTVPTGATNAEKELSSEQKQEYINKGIDTNSSDDRYNAFIAVVDVLDKNQLLGDNWDEKDLKTTRYYEETLKNYKETAIREKYKDCITESVRKNIGFSALENAYLEKYAVQADFDNAQFVEKLASATAEDPILVCNNGEYGFVYNLLLGANEDQLAELADWDAKNPNASKEERVAQRRAIFDSITVKDLRATWITAGYDFDGEKFTGDYTFAKDSANSLPFKGTTTLLNPNADVNAEDYAPEYRVDTIKEYGLNEFISMMEEYLYGEVKTQPQPETNKTYIYREYDADESSVVEYREKINELLFAFSTDEGSLNTYLGYEVKPIPDGSNAETYAQEFADAGRKLLGIGKETGMGKNSYVMAATDYGYHIMFYSQVFKKDAYNYSDLIDYLNFVDKKTADTWELELKARFENWEDYEGTYLYSLFESIYATEVANELTKRETKILDDYVYSANSGVVKYTDRYQDLLN